MKSSLEIAQEAELLPIETIAERTGLTPDEFEPYGRYKAKISLDVIDRLADQPNGKIVCVAGVTPTKAGEGKTTTAVGLTQGLGHIGKNPLLCLREPSLGPVFGIKGGAAGGGMTQVVPMEDLNLHFTGDIHAIGAANNLLAALLDASILHGNPHKIDALRVGWKRALDMNDRALRHVAFGSRRACQRLPARDRLRHHGRLRGDGDPGRGARPARPARTARGDHRGALVRRRQAGHRRGSRRGRRDDRAAEGRAEAQSDPDARGPALPDARGTVREHRARQLVAGGGPDRPEARRLRHHRVRLRVGHGDGEVLRHRVSQGRADAVSGCARRDRAGAEAPRRAGGRPARGFGGGARRGREGRGEPAAPPGDRQAVRPAVRGGGEPPARRHGRGGRARQEARDGGGRVRSRGERRLLARRRGSRRAGGGGGRRVRAAERVLSCSTTTTTRSRRRSARSRGRFTARRTSSSTWTRGAR